MYRRVLLALDLEGVNNVVGEPYMGLARDTEQWCVAREQAVLEINAAAEALFDAGVEKVGLWDNHGGGKNVDRDALDRRITVAEPEQGALRMSFADGEYDCICYFGYHTMEGTLGGVLAHTMNSKVMQYYKLNGRYIGEVDIDAYIAADKGISSRFFAGGDISCKQAKRSIGQIVTVETKKELSRNNAVFRDNADLMCDIKRSIVEAVRTEVPSERLEFPCVVEKSYKRTEDAAKNLAKLRASDIEVDNLEDEILGKDAHTLVVTVRNMNEFLKTI